MMRSRVALATCAGAADPDGEVVCEGLRAAGVHAEFAVWDDPLVSWDRYDLVLLRSTWDYAARRDAFLSWARRVSSRSLLVNSLAVVRWNTHKGYLADLAAQGLPVVPTSFVAPGEPVLLPSTGEYVVKPAVSAGSRDTARYGAEDEPAARAHAEALLHDGRTVMVQPYLAGVDEHGETALVYLDGSFSHALRKGAILQLRAGFVEGLHAAEEIAAADPRPAENALGDRVVAAVQERFGPVAYARVDLVADAHGAPLVLEVELTEPSLFLAEAGASAAPLVEAITALLAGSGQQGVGVHSG